MIPCLHCQGIGWKRGTIKAHGQTYTTTRVCEVCKGKGKVRIMTAPDAKSLAANDHMEEHFE